MCVQVYQSVTKAAVKNKTQIHQIPLSTPGFTFLIRFILPLYSTVHCTFVCGFRFLWFNLSRCSTVNVLYLDKQKGCTAPWRSYISWHFHLAGQHRKHIDFTWLLCLCRSLQGPEQEQPILMSQFALNSHVFVSEWKTSVLLTLHTWFCMFFFHKVVDSPQFWQTFYNVVTLPCDVGGFIQLVTSYLLFLFLFFAL